MALLPLGFVAAVGIETGWPTIKALVFRPRVAELLSNTLWLTLLAVPISIALGVAVAGSLNAPRLPGVSYGRRWRSRRWLSRHLSRAMRVSAVPSLHGLSAGVFLSVLAYYPFIYMPVAAVLRRLDPTLEDVAASLGTPPWKVFFRVVLPQLRLAICGGALLVALHLLAEYGLYVMIRFDTFTTAIYDQFQSTFSGPAANMLAGCWRCVVWRFCYWRASRAAKRVTRVSAGAAREQKRRPLGNVAAWGAQLLLLTLVMLAMGVPLLVLCRWLWLGGVENWLHADLWHSLRQTLLLGAGGALLTTACAIPIAWLGVRYPRRLFRLLEGCNYITSSLPGIVTALALVTVTIHYARPVYQTEVTLFLAYLLMFMPRALINLRAGIARRRLSWKMSPVALAQPGPRLMERHHAAGRAGSRWRRAGVSWREQRAHRDVAAIAVRHPYAVDRFWALTSEIDYVAAAPYAMLMIVISLPLTAVLYVQSKNCRVVTCWNCLLSRNLSPTRWCSITLI